MLSCQQDELNDKDVLVDDSFRTLAVQNISDLVAHVENPELRAIDEIVLDLSIALQDELEDKDLRNSVYSQARKYDQKTAFILDILNKQNISQRNAKLNQLLSSAANMQYEGESYSANLYIPNLEQADLEKTPIISPAYELEDTDDCIAAYRKDSKSGTWYLIMLSEEEALSTDEPIMVVSQSTEKTKEIIKKNLFLPKTKSNFEDIIFNERQAATSYYTNNFTIYGRHESSGRSEVAICQVTYQNTGFIESRGSNEFKFAEVRKRNIGDNRSSRAYITDDRYTRHGQYGQTGSFTAFNMFERDWHHGSKPFGKVTYGGQTLYLQGDARFSGDFYLHSPFGSGTVPVFNDNIVNVYGSITYSYPSYGKLKVTK